MSFWTNIYFIDANSPLIEQIIYFHDHSIVVIFSIITFLLIAIIFISNTKLIFLNLNENQTIEIVWTILPIILLCLIAIPRLRLLYLIEENFTPSISLKVIGHQWYWSYEYSDFIINFDSFIIPNSSNLNNFRLLETDTPIFLPFNIFTRLLVSSRDVIHAWTIQTLGVKTDAVPGRLNQINLIPSRPGHFFGQCSEICGSNHRFIPISLKVSSMHTFISWLKTFN